MVRLKHKPLFGAVFFGSSAGFGGDWIVVLGGRRCFAGVAGGGFVVMIGSAFLSHENAFLVTFVARQK
ncbi:hypothetical protein CupriaWKF_11355 [Cupriavidus sp. WKF15]|uniref:hypothetical protein n=1 Tax=Cupriavidus sp. WKF15 TaxID=3032282 RepID=UPI0023E2B4A2|nr:hypothetical protein [Cupriavidus sp. WKF15]WER44922.1 hypothetical protein CupriaWKF_11355 [Cupriavidus sp. WKF15]